MKQLTFICSVAATVVFMSCQKEGDQYKELLLNKTYQTTLDSVYDQTSSLSGEAFVYQMRCKGGCPNSGSSCSKKSSPKLADDVEYAFLSAIDKGAKGLQDFYTAGPWRELHPGLDIQRKDIYLAFTSGLYEGRITNLGTSTVVDIGLAPFSNEDNVCASYRVILEQSAD